LRERVGTLGECVPVLVISVRINCINCIVFVFVPRVERAARTGLFGEKGQAKDNASRGM